MVCNATGEHICKDSLCGSHTNSSHILQIILVSCVVNTALEYGYLGFVLFSLGETKNFCSTIVTHFVVM